MSTIGETARSASGVWIQPGTWLCCGGATLGALGLIGWFSGASVLTTIVPGLPAMTPTTAAALLMIGAVGAARQPHRRGPLSNTLSVLLSLVVLAVGAGTLAEYGLGIDLPINLTFPGSQPTLLSSQPAPLTALALTCLGAAVLLFDVRVSDRLRPSEWLVLGSALTAYTGLTGIILGAAPQYPFTRTPVIGLSLPTAVSLLLTSMGLLLARPSAGIMRVATSEGAGGILLRRLALPAIIAPVLLGLLVTRLFAPQERIAESIPVAILAATMAAVSLLLLAVTAVPLNRAHRDIEASRNQTRTLVEQAPDGIFVADTEGRYTDVNDAGCRMLGYSRAEIVGTTIVDLIPANDIERLWRVREQLLEGATHLAEWSLRRKDGRLIPVEVSSSILPDGRWQGFVRDITERKRIENEQRFLAELGSVLATTIDYEDTLSRIADIATRGLSDFCIIDLLDEKGEVRRLRVVSRDPANAGICDKLRRTPLDRERPHVVRSALESGHPVLAARLSPEDVEALCPDADHREALRAVELQSLIVVPLVTSGRLLGAISFLSASPSPVYGPDDLRVARDVAQRAALAVDNARLYRAAQQAIQMRDDVLGIVAHDLRNPLSMILTEARLLGPSGLEPERRRREPAELINRAATRMNRLIQDLLDVTSIEARQLSLEPTRVRAAQLVCDAVDVYRAMASSGSIELRLAGSEEMPDVWADRDRLLQVFDNLIGNAIKFTPPGGCITVGASIRDADVLFRVDDTGEGIAPEDQPHVFDRFWQASRTTRTGAGLGLPIAKGIVEAHRGSVWVESDPGRGSTFLFTIPLAPRIERAPDDSAASHSVGSGGRGSASHPEGGRDPLFSSRCPRVLLADDHEGILSAFERLLTPSCEVVGQVKDVDALIDAAARLQPDIIILDLFISRRHGLELCRHLKQVVPQTTIIVASAVDDASIGDAALRAGASAFVAKTRAATELLPAIFKVKIV